MSLGLPKGTVLLVDYDPAWPRLFEEERARLGPALDGAALAVEHIGSTAVPGLPAKPVLDIAVALPGIAAVPGLVAPLAALGYGYLGEYGLPGRHFFQRGEPTTHHLHLVEITSEHWRVWRLFRDYLRRHAEDARRYADFKRELAVRYAADRDAYTRSKTDFVNAILAKAGKSNGEYKPPSARLGEKGAR